jgi:hypothetical protein
MKDTLQRAGPKEREPFRFTPLNFANPPSHPWNLIGPPMWAMSLLFGIAPGSKSAPITRFEDTARQPPESPRVKVWVQIILISLVYVSLHILGWNFFFPTRAEPSLWRAASVGLVWYLTSYGLCFIILGLQLPYPSRVFGRLIRVREARNVLEYL